MTTATDFQAHRAEMATLTEQIATAKTEMYESAKEMTDLHKQMGDESADRAKLDADFAVASTRNKGKKQDVELLEARFNNLAAAVSQKAIVEQANGNDKPMMEVSEALGHIVNLQNADAAKKASKEQLESARASLPAQGFKVTENQGLIKVEMVSTTDGNNSSINYSDAVPTTTAASFTTRLKAWGGATKAVRVENSATGNPAKYPTIDYTGKVATVKEEGATAASAELAQPSEVTWDPYILETGVIPISTQTIRDSAPNVLSMAYMQVDSMRGRTINSHLTNGHTRGGNANGNGSTQGLIAGSAEGERITSATLTYNMLVSLRFSVNAGYRRTNYGSLQLGDTMPGMVCYMFSDNVLAEIWKLRDTQNRPLWLPSVREGSEGTILGDEYVINEDMPDWEQKAAGQGDTITMLYGNFDYYLARFVTPGSKVQVYTDSAFAKDGNIGMQAFSEMCGAYMGAFSSGNTTEAVKHLVIQDAN